MTEIHIPKYITHVQLSKARKAKYYKRGTAVAKNRPAKYKTKAYKFNAAGYLCSPSGERVVANSKSVGTPRYLKINGQQLYSGNMNAMIRSKVVNEIKSFFHQFVKDLPPMKVPVRLESDLYAPLAAKNWDLDNQWIYHKCFLDALVNAGVLPDDNVMFVTQAPAFRYFPVDSDEERAITYRIIPEDREEILQHEAYLAFHDNPEPDEALTF